MEVEMKLKDLYESIDDGSLSEIQLKELKELETTQHSYLKNEEESRRLKSRALWLSTGDNNTVFPSIANLRKNINTIWEIIN
jgi:hypothetical protein